MTRSSARRRAVAAALAYLALSVWALRVVLPAADRTYPIRATEPENGVGLGDQSLIVWATSRNARVLVTEPTALLDFEQSHPLARAAGLGHPLYADGVMAIPLWLLGLDPIELLNASSVLMLWLSALTTFFLVRYWTGSDAAAFAAGLALAFQPNRIFRAHWPGIYGSPWSPLVVLFAHRLLSRGGWRDAVALASFLALLILGSVYQLIPLAVMGVPFVAWLAVRHRDRLAEAVPKLLFVAVVAALSAVVQFSAHLHLKEVWTFGGRSTILPAFATFLPGAVNNPGVTVLLLAALGVVDRLRGPRRDPTGDDPRLVVLLMGCLALWLMVISLSIPGTGIYLPSLLSLLAAVVPALDSLRVASIGRMAIYLPTAVLAAYGVVCLTAGGGRRRSAVVATLVAVCLVAEVFVPAIARRSFGRDVEMRAQDLSPPSPELRALFAATLDGPVLDVPICAQLGFRCRAHALLLAAYHEQPVAWGVGSQRSPLAPAVKRLARRLPDPAAADALYALGFRNVVLHAEAPRGAPHPLTALEPSPAGRLEPVGSADGHRVYRLGSPVPVTTDLAALAPVQRATEQSLSSSETEIVFHVQNATPTTFRHPDPIEPSDVIVTWRVRSGRVVGRQHVRALLPIAVAAGAQESLSIAVDPPDATGLLTATVTTSQTPTRPLAVARVRVAG
jgi:hypothetical protein